MELGTALQTHAPTEEYLNYYGAISPRVAFWPRCVMGSRFHSSAVTKLMFWHATFHHVGLAAADPI